jgi:hypothetical protein
VAALYIDQSIAAIGVFILLVLGMVLSTIRYSPRPSGESGHERAERREQSWYT